MDFLLNELKTLVVRFGELLITLKAKGEEADKKLAAIKIQEQELAVKELNLIERETAVSKIEDVIYLKEKVQKSIDEANTLKKEAIELSLKSKQELDASTKRIQEYERQNSVQSAYIRKASDDIKSKREELDKREKDMRENILQELIKKVK